MSAAYDEILDFITSAPSLQAIVDFQHSPETLERVVYLRAATQQDILTEAEREELREFNRASELMEQLKIRSRRRLGMAEDGF